MKNLDDVKEYILDVINEYRFNEILSDENRLKIHSSIKSFLKGQFEKLTFSIDYDDTATTILTLYFYDEGGSRFVVSSSINHGHIGIDSVSNLSNLSGSTNTMSYEEMTEDMSDDMRDLLCIDECDELEEDDSNNIEGKTIEDILLELGSMFREKIAIFFERLIKDNKVYSIITFETKDYDEPIRYSFEYDTFTLEKKETKKVIIDKFMEMVGCDNSVSFDEE